MCAGHAVWIGLDSLAKEPHMQAKSSDSSGIDPGVQRHAIHHIPDLQVFTHYLVRLDEISTKPEQPKVKAQHELRNSTDGKQRHDQSRSIPPASLNRNVEKYLHGCAK